MIPTSLDVRLKNPQLPYAIFGLMAGTAVLLAVGLGYDAVVGKPGAHWDWMSIHMEDPLPSGWLLAIFSHADFWHWFGNMLYLWAFGLALEDRLGWKKFLGLFVGCGLVATLIELAFFWMTVPEGVKPLRHWGMGASGAVFGIMGLSMARFPKAKLRFVGFGFMPYTFWVPLGWFMTWRVFLELISMGTGDGIGHFAHVLGCAVGLLSARLLHLEHAGKDEVIELQAEAHYDAGDFTGALKYYDKLMVINPKRGLYRLKRTDCLYRSWPSAGKPSESLRKDTLAQWQRGLTASLAEGKAAEAVEWLQHFIPPFAISDLEPGLAAHVELARKKVAAASGMVPLTVNAQGKARFLDGDDRNNKQAQARQELELAARKRDWGAASEAAELLRQFLDLKEWSAQELLWGGEALRASGARFWEDLYERASNIGNEDQTVKALQVLESCWHGQTQHGKYAAQLKRSAERLEYLPQRPDYQTLVARLNTVA